MDNLKYPLCSVCVIISSVIAIICMCNIGDQGNNRKDGVESRG